MCFHNSRLAAYGLSSEPPFDWQWDGCESRIELSMSALPYRPAIDGLRAIAVLAVFVFHLNHAWLPGGFVGVDVFFVISGYLITSIILRDCEKGEFSLLGFYQRRIARIFPTFFAVAVATLFGASIIYTPQDYASAGANLVAVALSVANLKFIFQGNYFGISADAQPFLHYWSLSVEEQFYLIFPLLFLLVYKYRRTQLVPSLVMLGIGSLIACLALTPGKPVWAFYLLPTRAWELCAGSLLALISARSATASTSSWRAWLQPLGLLLIGLSFMVVHEGPHFPGWVALLPVAGTVAILLPSSVGNARVERWLSASPLVRIGRGSYSLYLWHWPVFSLVDYHLYLSPEPLRVVLKVGLSCLLTCLTFVVIENPSRIFLNQRRNWGIAYAALAVALAISIPLGISIRRNNYVNAELAEVAKGGLVFTGKPGAKSVVLMGDSNGSMYGKVMKSICEELGYKLTVISVAAGDPLPSSGGQHDRLWADSFAVVEREKPDVLVLACRWESKLSTDKGRLDVALGKLAPHASRILILNQPPILPAAANRANLRNGLRPPFLENETSRSERLLVNDYLRGRRSENITVLDVAARFQGADGEVLFLDERGRQLYHDSTHLSGYGADLIRPVIQSALQDRPN